MSETQKYPDGDCRRRFGGSSPVSRKTSRGRGNGPIGASVYGASHWKDLGGAKVVQDVRPNARPGSVVAVDGGGTTLFGTLALMVLSRFTRGRSRRGH